LSWLAESSVGEVLCSARVVGSVTEPRLTDDQVAFVRDDEVHVATRLHQLAVLQPERLQHSAAATIRSVSATAARCWAQTNKLPDSMDAGEPTN